MSIGIMINMTEKRFLLEDSDYDLEYEFSVADLSRVEKTKEDFWNEKEEVYDYFDYIEYLYENNAFLTTDEADKILNELAEENKQLKNNLSEIEKIINNRLNLNVVPTFPDGKTKLGVEERWGYFYALEQLKKKLIRTDLLFQNEKED